jgi:hypothetical protein
LAVTPGNEPVPPAGSPDSPSQLPSLRRIGEFLRNVLDLERLVRRTDDRVGKLEEELRQLQRQVDDHGGQLKALTAFVANAADKAESRSEETALRTVERYLQALEFAKLRSDKPDEK